MALAMRGFILGAPKPNRVQIPSCKSYQQKAITMLQTQNLGLKHARKISRSFITCDNKKHVGTGGGPKTNQAPASSEKLTASNVSSTNSERTGTKSKGETNATPKKTS